MKDTGVHRRAAELINIASATSLVDAPLRMNLLTTKGETQ